MKIAYFPGCTLKAAAKNFEDSALAAAQALGIEMVELPRWTCCGTVYSLSTDDLMHHIAPVRNLLRVAESGYDKVVTLCAMCYNTLKMSNLRFRQNPADREKITQFMYEEKTQYDGQVEVYHLLELLRDKVGFDKIEEKIKKPLKGLKVSPYYGCTLLRPKEAAIDDPESPQLMAKLLTAMGAEVVDFPYNIECCGSYLTVNKVDFVAQRTKEIVGQAQSLGAELLMQSCPLCDFNLSGRQKEAQKQFSDFKPMPTLYFTQLLALSLGLNGRSLRFDLNYVNPEPLLAKKGLI
jgi:heterodisulfide reductase subunit B